MTSRGVLAPPAGRGGGAKPFGKVRRWRGRKNYKRSSPSLPRGLADGTHWSPKRRNFPTDCQGHPFAVPSFSKNIILGTNLFSRHGSLYKKKRKEAQPSQGAKPGKNGFITNIIKKQLSHSLRSGGREASYFCQRTKR